MAKNSTKDLEQFISRFQPLNQIPKKYHTQLVSHLSVMTIRSGEKFIRKAKESNESHFLLKGRIEIRESFDNRYSLSNLDQRKVALEDQVTKNGTVKALTPCTLMVINNEIIDQYLLWNEEYSVRHIDDTDTILDADDLIDDNFQEDWENVFLQSPLAANLSNIAIHKLMSQLEDVPVKKNQIIVKTHAEGDYFYLIKKGFAQVRTDTHGPFKGLKFSLTAGNHFGDEALVASTIRNATVVMTSDGTLGKLNATTFLEIVKEQLIPLFEMPKDGNKNDLRVIDVRLAQEFKKGHISGSTNIPISHLRTKLSNLKKSYVYIITPANDKRSELGTYLMRQAGYDAYQLAPKPPETVES